jgi:hypothetical protein
MVIFFDGWETGQTWSVLWDCTLSRVTTDPFEGTYCLKGEKHGTGLGGGAYKDGIYGDPDHVTVEVAFKYVPDPGDTGQANIYFYNKDHSKLFAIATITNDGHCYITGGDGLTLLYAGSVNTWYRFILKIKWEEKKFDCALYDRNGVLLESVADKTSMENASVVVTAHVMFYLATNTKGTFYADYVQCQKTVVTELNYTDVITLSEKQEEPEDAGGYWIHGFWVRKVRDRLDAYLDDDHNIPMAVMQLIRDNLKERL